jgi:hypothetical protein
MDAHIKRHQPLITARLIFAPKSLFPPPIITTQMEFPLFSIPQYREWSPPPKNPREHSLTPERHTTLKHAPPLRHPTPQCDATPTRKRLEKNFVTFEDNSVTVVDDEDMGSPLTSLSDEDNELESEEMER